MHVGEFDPIRVLGECEPRRKHPRRRSRQQQMAQPGVVGHLLDLRAAELHRVEFREPELPEHRGGFGGRFKPPADRRAVQHRNPGGPRVQHRQRRGAGVQPDMVERTFQPPGAAHILRAVVAQVAGQNIAEFRTDQRVAAD